MVANPKYARIEWERRFLLTRFPEDVDVVCTRRIVDRYLRGTRLRLRRMEGRGEPVLKLTQKIPSGMGNAQQGLITSIYLTEDEYAVLEKLPANLLSKVRHSVLPYGIDIFEGELRGLVLAEAEFDSEGESKTLSLPSFLVNEVTGDQRFTGGRLASATRSELQSWLTEYGLTLP